jgi:hypothetical protein
MEGARQLRRPRLTEGRPTQKARFADLNFDQLGLPALANSLDSDERLGLALVVEGEGERPGEAARGR